MDYIGLHFKEKGRTVKGVDCYGLIRLWYKNEFRIDLPSHIKSYENTSDVSASESMDENRLADWVEVDEPLRGDVVLLRIKGLPWHVGIYLGFDKMLHVERGCDSVIEKLGRSKWKNRIIGYYRLK